ncbi:MAG: precorrin-8X methylmutase [Candidatus Caldatribacterium sp.]|uniref:precorrin-8X methylmutase n=1 Tax=Candidatus Caldatribacterium sp. TaxID=2282143 RepID=UPI0029970100|nr:precorrin-8X methylmutase [Candidatus Caldatribacterium sp.]MCX7729968.1 precorrin-8X methylmutase [Candidatus Caldatribacterium sp.]MDW8080287.1 precorrin-8X methylmutase [Candidatus Calescibacterium sp.]
MKGDDIEKRSLTLIRQVLDAFALPEYGRFIVERVVHATADFSLAPLVVIRPGFVERFLETLRIQGYVVFCDTATVCAGISPGLLSRSALVLREFVHTPRCLGRVTSSKTRAEVAVELALEEGIRGFVFGNSPTGLSRLVEAIRGGYVVDWVIGCPVGFIGAAEAKEALLTLSVPVVVVRGPRGGSTVAASIVNALLAYAFK